MDEGSRQRERAADLFDRGAAQAEIARDLHVSRVTAMRWHRLWCAGGRDGLLARSRPGRRPRLTTGELQGVRAALLRSPRASGLELDEWSLDGVIALVERHTSVRYHPGHVGRLLRRIGWVVPPVGPHRTHALLATAGPRDPDGNGLLLFRRGPQCS